MARRAATACVLAAWIPATRADLNGASGEKVFGLFNTGNLTLEKAKKDNPDAPDDDWQGD